MAIIYSYPGKSPVTANDTVVITDSSTTTQAASATKSATMSTIASYVINDSGNSIPLQRVLNDGATATSQSQTWNGRIRLDSGSGSPVGDPIQFLVQGDPGVGVNTLKFEYNTDSTLLSQLQVVGGVEFKTTTSGGGEKLFTFNKTNGNVVVGSNTQTNTLTVVGASSLNNGDLVVDKSVNNQTITALAGDNITITGPEGITLQTTKSVNDDILIDAANGSAIGGNLTMYGKTVQLQSVGNGGNMLLQSQYQPGAAATGLHLQTTGANSIIKIESNQDDVQIVAPTGEVQIGNLTQLNRKVVISTIPSGGTTDREAVQFYTNSPSSYDYVKSWQRFKLPNVAGNDTGGDTRLSLEFENTNGSNGNKGLRGQFGDKFDLISDTEVIATVAPDSFNIIKGGASFPEQGATPNTTYELVNRFASGTIETNDIIILNNGVAEPTGLLNGPASRAYYQVVNNVVSGFAHLVFNNNTLTLAGSLFGLDLTVTNGTGSGASLFALYPADNFQPGSISVGQLINWDTNRTVVGAVIDASNKIVFKRYEDGSGGDFNLANIGGGSPNQIVFSGGSTISFSFTYYTAPYTP